MSESRPALVPSLSFSGSSSASLSRPPKRRYTSAQELDFFTPSASTFHPRPYTHVNRDRHEKTFHTRNMRSVDSLALTSKGMDPDPSDPSVVIIHPPFTSFPGSERYPEGLTYQLLTENAEWFLDPVDFISPNSESSKAISYPPALEPPRGWCPAKKKDLQSRGAEGWPEGEEPRLRCTFCRRTYAGVNARSMWRRHVYEKHKIAMSNRRDSGDKPRGRGSNKENRVSSTNGTGNHKGLVDIDVFTANGTDSRGLSYKSTFRSTNPTRHRSLSSASHSDLHLPYEEIEDDPSPRPQTFSHSTLPPVSSPPSPPSPQLVDSDASFDTTTSLASPLSSLPIIPPSPYDPLKTPAFKYSPPRLPSDQPWRFPSPSHPLHSFAQEVCLTMLTRDLGGSPPVKSSSMIASADIHHKTPFRSPFVKPANGQVLGTPDSITKAYRPSPKNLFLNSEKMARFPFASRLRMRHEIDSSPLRRSSKPIKQRPSPGPSSDDWPSDSLVLEAIPSEQDPFTGSWKPSQGEIISKDCSTLPMSGREAESPVVHKHIGLNTADRPMIGLGLGLLEPFRLPEDSESIIDDSDFETERRFPDENGEAIGVKDTWIGGNQSTSTPPTKRRKTID